MGGEVSRGKARMRVLSNTKPEGWQDELPYLHEQEKQRLRKSSCSFACQTLDHCQCAGPTLESCRLTNNVWLRL